MNKEYRYRKHIRWGQYLISALFVFLIILFWGIILFISLIKGVIPKILLVVVSFLSSLFLLEGTFLWYLFYRMSGISVSITEDSIIYRNRRGEKNILFSTISHLKFPSLPYTGGWIEIISKSNTIRLTVVLQNIGDFLQELKNALDQNGLANCYDRRKFFRFFKTAVYSDQSWTRLYSNFWKLILATILSATIGVIYAIPTHPSISGIILWITLFALWPTTLYLYTEFRFGCRIAKLSNEESFTCPPQDSAYERAFYRKVVLFGILIYFIIATFACILLK